MSKSNNIPSNENIIHDESSDDNHPVASMPTKRVANNVDDDEEDEDYDKFKSSLGKRSLEDFLLEKQSSMATNIQNLTTLWLPFLNIENGPENAVTTEGILPLLDLLELPLTRTCGRYQESSSVISNIPLLHVQQKDNWSCGYRNVQMMLSSLLPLLPSDHAYHTCNIVSPALKRSDLGVAVPIPSLRDLQEWLEAAWRLGLDPQGAAHYNGRIIGKSDKIGAIEVASLLAAVRLDSVVIQFILTYESRRCLGPFVWNYFCIGAPLSPSFQESAVQRAQIILQHVNYQFQTQTTKTNPNITPSGLIGPSRIPLYLQWEGHSVTIIGIRKVASTDHEHNPQYQLLVLDPFQDGSLLHRELGSAFDTSSTLEQDSIVRLLILDAAKLKQRDCQIVLATSRSLGSHGLNIQAITAAADSVARRQQMQQRQQIQQQQHQPQQQQFLQQQIQQSQQRQQIQPQIQQPQNWNPTDNRRDVTPDHVPTKDSKQNEKETEHDDNSVEDEEDYDDYDEEENYSDEDDEEEDEDDDIQKTDESDNLRHGNRDINDSDSKGN
jgi:Peptidase family C78